MELTLNELLNGKGTKIRNNEYLTTAQYVEPFIEKMSKYTDNFLVQAKLPTQVSLTTQEDIRDIDIVYNRVWVQAVLPNEYCYTGHQMVVGLVYGLDTRKPVAKIYVGALRSACLNLCVFNPSFLEVQYLEPERPINYKCVEPLMEQESDIAKWLIMLEEMEVPYNIPYINEMLGAWVRNSLSASFDNGYGKVKLATATAVDAYKLLYEDEESDYYVSPGQSTNMFNVYNAFTQLISNTDTRDIINKVEKILLLKKVLDLSI